VPVYVIRKIGESETGKNRMVKVCDNRAVVELRKIVSVVLLFLLLRYVYYTHSALSSHDHV